MDDSTTNKEVEQLTPGAILRQTRERLGPSQQDVAAKLRLSVQCVIDLEYDDYRHMAAPIYLRGYLRSYARLLGISEEQVLEAYDALDDTFQKPVREETVTLSAQQDLPVYTQRTDRKHKVARWVSAGVAALLVVLVAAWWDGQSSKPTTIKLANHTQQSAIATETPATPQLQAVKAVKAKATKTTYHIGPITHGK